MDASSERTTPVSGSDLVKEKIMNAAIHCFSRLSTERATISDIARVAGLSRQTVYKYFKSKEDIISEATAHKARAISALVTSRAAPHLSADQKLEEAVVACVEYTSSDPASRGFFNLSVHELVVMLGTQGVAITPSRERWLPILQEGVKDGTFRADLDIEMTIAWLNDIQFILVARVVSLGESIEQIRKFIRFYLFNGMLAR